MALFDKLNLPDLNVDDIQNTYLGLEHRQQLVVNIGAVILCLALLFMPIQCISSKVSGEKTNFNSFTREASKFYGARSEYQQLRKKFSRLKDVIKTKNLGSDPLKQILLDVAEKVGWEERRVKFTKEPDRDTNLIRVESKKVTIQNVRFDEGIRYLSQLVDFEGLPVTISTLEMQASSNNKQMIKSMTFSVSLLTPKTSAKDSSNSGRSGRNRR